MNEPISTAGPATLHRQGVGVAPVGQATSVEQSRAIAEVQGAIVLAAQRPRNRQLAIEEMRESCSIIEMAQSAFYKFPRGGSTVSGESIQLARELARCWGNIDYGVKELSRDMTAGQSEMLAFAWDLQTNVRSETTFIVPHIRDRSAGKGGNERLVDMRDIYENNANMGARRLREQIFAVMPKWFTEQAVTICHATLQGGGGEPLPIRVAKMITYFESLKVSKAEIERKVGCKIEDIDAVTLANLQITFNSIRRGTVTKEDEFPSDVARIAAGVAEQAEQSLSQPITGAQPAVKTSKEKTTEDWAEEMRQCGTIEAFDKKWNDAPIEVTRELGAPFCDEQKSRIEALKSGGGQGNML